jgi:hypothetical protein
MTHQRSLLLLAALGFASCSGSSSGGDSATVSLAVTDAATDQLSAFVIGIESVQLTTSSGGTVDILQQPIAVDFVALTDFSRVLNVATLPEGVYTGVNVELLYDADRVFINGNNVPATLVDSSGNPLAGTQTLPIVFALPLQVTSGNYVIELDLDLNQSIDVDTLNNEVAFEPALLPRVNRTDPKEHAVGGSLRTVVLDQDLIRIGLEGLTGSATTVVEIEIGPGTVFQVDGQCLLGAAGLSVVDALAPNTWVQAFGSLDASSSRFQASTVEAGTGSFNGGSDIVEGVIVGRTGGAGADADLVVRGHSSNSVHTVFEFNLTYTIQTSFANTKVVRRGSATQFDTDDLNIGQRIRAFGVLDTITNTLDATTTSDVVRMEPTWVFGLAKEVPTNGQSFEIDLARVDLRDQSDFSWTDANTTAADPANFALDNSANLAGGQSIAINTPIVALGFFSAVDDDNEDFVPSVIANRELLPSLLLVRDRANGFTVSTTTSSTSIDFTFANAASGIEKAVVDMGFAGETDVTTTGISITPKVLSGLGLYLLYDRTLNTVGVYLTFSSFSQALDDAFTNGATLFNVGALGVYDDANDRIPSALAGITVQ